MNTMKITTHLLYISATDPKGIYDDTRIMSPEDADLLCRVGLIDLYSDDDSTGTACYDSEQTELVVEILNRFEA